MTRPGHRNIALAVFTLLLAACDRTATSNSDADASKNTEVPSQRSKPIPIERANVTVDSLQARLGKRQADFVSSAPPELVAKVNTAITELGESNILDNAIAMGDKAPDFTLPNALGDSVSLYEQLEKGPVILTWYRGSWCPYCNIQLHDYQSSLPEIHAAGAQLLALSPELPDSALSWKEKNELEFVVLTDLGNKVAGEYGIVWQIPDNLAEVYSKGGRIDLAKFNGDESLQLPLAATYVIGTDGTVEYSYLDVDYRKRAETSEVVAAVTQLSARAN